MYSVMACENTSPPTTARPSGWRSSAPAPRPSAIGSAPISAASVVIMMGRKRSMQASRMACCGVMPCCRCASSAKSIIMMAFFFTMPISSRMPMVAISVRSMPKSISVASAPTAGRGQARPGW
jgi:hypothetical protein